MHLEVQRVQSLLDLVLGLGVGLKAPQYVLFFALETIEIAVDGVDLALKMLLLLVDCLQLADFASQSFAESHRGALHLPAIEDFAAFIMACLLFVAQLGNLSIELADLLVELLLGGCFEHLFFGGELGQLGVCFNHDLLVSGSFVVVELVEPRIFIFIAVISVALATAPLRVISTTAPLVIVVAGCLSFFIIELFQRFLGCSLRSLLLSASAASATLLLGFAHLLLS